MTMTDFDTKIRSGQVYYADAGGYRVIRSVSTRWVYYQIQIDVGLFLPITRGHKGTVLFAIELGNWVLIN